MLNLLDVEEDVFELLRCDMHLVLLGKHGRAEFLLANETQYDGDETRNIHSNSPD